jgi:hypothetical protein
VGVWDKIQGSPYGGLCGGHVWNQDFGGRILCGAPSATPASFRIGRGKSCCASGRGVQRRWLRIGSSGVTNPPPGATKPTAASGGGPPTTIRGYPPCRSTPTVAALTSGLAVQRPGEEWTRRWIRADLRCACTRRSRSVQAPRSQRWRCRARRARESILDLLVSTAALVQTPPYSVLQFGEGEGLIRGPIEQAGKTDRANCVCCLENAS